MSEKNEYLASALEKVYSKDEDFIIFGLTGRTGSGCTLASEILSSEKKNIEHSLYNGVEPTNNIQRKEKVISNFFDKNWVPFTHLRASSILSLMLLERKSFDEIQSFLNTIENIRQQDLECFRYCHEKIQTAIQNEVTGKEFYIELLQEVTNNIRSRLEDAIFISLYQNLGKNARRSGDVTKSEFKNGEFFSIAKKIKTAMLSIHADNKENQSSTHIVIDAIRSPLEANYLQERFGAFYLLAVSCDDKVRKERLTKKGLDENSIKAIDQNEYSPLDFDDQKSFTDQDIQGCLQKADIYLNNSLDNSDSKYLADQLIKFVALAQKPGLVTPTSEERCMQVAYTAKLSSGCLSRQVGAVVTNELFAIKSVGWNDTPFGHVPCNLRSIKTLENKEDRAAYSPFEREDSKFNTFLIKKVEKYAPIEDKGYNPAFCFKSEYNSFKNEKNQVHTRSLHAEENAFLQISKDGGQGVKGGNLFTTASPCELCAKKAYQLGIKNIFYIDPYPGISQSHILSAGIQGTQPDMKLFSGAIGKAFHNLYSPIAPYKDELNALID